MRIRVAASAAELAYLELKASTTAVVIDVFRATSVIATAIANGAAAIYPLIEVEEARALATRWPADEVLLVGERNALPLPGFDLGNSPLDFTAERVAAKQIVMTTSNGTRALQAAKAAGNILIASLLNIDAVAARLLKAQTEDIVIVCAGTYNQLDIPDSLTAGALIHALQAAGQEPTLNDLGLICHHYFQPQSYQQRCRDSWHGRRLIELGMERDLDTCLQMNLLDVVPRFDGVKISA